MFVDQADIEVLAGDGGRGCVSFRKEKYIPEGGPDGGDGGDGGSVFLRATPGVDTLLDMVGRHHWRARGGENGMGKKCAGRDGEDLVIRVPAGTLVYDRTSGLLIADLKEPGHEVRVAKGGRGGKGNWQFTTPVRQAPDFAEPGERGQVRVLHLELRLIADVGVVGLPNAGKSTLLSRVSHARPKIADYPFTTLVPQLGIAELDNERRLVIADIPGLIEGASEGAGLGQDFLRHIERTRVIVHILDVMPLDGTVPVEGYRQIRAELAAYSPKLAAKPEILAANKMDLAGASEALADLRQALPGKQIFAISAVAGTGMKPLMEALWQQVKVAPESGPLVTERPYVPPVKEGDKRREAEVAAVPQKERSEEEKFVVVEGEADEGAWEAVDGEGALETVQDEDETQDAKRKTQNAGGGRGAVGPMTVVGAEEDRRKVFVDARGEPVKLARKTKRGTAGKVKRTMIEPVKQGAVTLKKRKRARERREEHEEKVKRRKAARGGLVVPVVDAELAKEIEAIKADDVRKGRYYNRKRDM